MVDEKDDAGTYRIAHLFADHGTESEVLEVAPDADPAVVEAAARRRKAQTHPDQGGDEEAYKRVVKAEEAMLNE